MVLLGKTLFSDEHQLEKSTEYPCSPITAPLAVFGNIGEKAKAQLAK